MEIVKHLLLGSSVSVRLRTTSLRPSWYHRYTTLSGVKAKSYTDDFRFDRAGGVGNRDAPLPGHVHLWWLPMPSIDCVDGRERMYIECRDILHKSEVDELSAALVQSSRGKQPVVDRLVSRAYLRRVLAEYPTLVGSPCDLVFSRNNHGKPELVCGDAPSPIRFNLTHTRGVVGVAVSTDKAIGIDVEALARETREMKLAQKYFSKDEVAVLQDMPPGPERRSMFVRIWTLKEAYVKAIGRGIGAPPGMSSFGVVVDVAHQQIDFRPSDKEPRDTDCWFFQLVEPLPGYVGAVCAEGGHTVHAFTTPHMTSDPLRGHHMPLLAQSSPCHPT